MYNNHEMPTIFKCKTNDAYKIKIMSEMLSHNLKVGSFEVTSAGITLRMFDTQRKIMIDLKLEADNFTFFKLVGGPLHMGINMKHFYRILKSIKKKDSLQLFVEKNDPTLLYIRSIPKENTRVTTSTLKIQNLQHILMDIPTGYKQPVVVNASDFQKMCKEIVSIGSLNIRVESKRSVIEFAADADGILTRKVSLGDHDADNDSDSENEMVDDDYKATFQTELFARFQKITNLGDSVRIYTNSELPICIRTNIGTMGSMSIYVKSRELVDMEAELSSDSE